MATDAPVADSSTAAPFTSTDTLRALNPDQRAEWRLTGKLPAASTTTDPIAKTDDPAPSIAADSTPAKPAEQAASTDATPKADSEPAEDVKPKTKARIDELLAGRASEKARADKLQQQIDALLAHPAPRTDEKVAEPSTAQPGTREDAQRYAPDLTKPQLADVEFAALFPDATYGDYANYSVKYALASDKASSAQTSVIDARRSAFGTQIQATLAKEPEFFAGLDARVRSLVPVDGLKAGETPTPLNRIAQEIFVSPIATDLMRHLSAHPDELDRIAGLSPEAITREMGKLEGKVEALAATPAVPAVPVAPVVSNAPAVIETVGRKPALDADPVEAALAAKDFPRYREAMNARDMARAGVR